LAGPLSDPPENIVLLHGFGGTGRTWDGVLERLPAESPALALDLPGHGAEARSGSPITFDGCVEHVLAASPRSFVLCGYSLGGRVALHVALAAPERVRRLVLVSTGAGIEDPLERERRRSADHALAEDLEGGPFAEFLERWNAQPLFAEDPPAVVALARQDQLRNRAGGLAAALRGIGGGEMEPLWGRLGEIDRPATVLVGQRDERYLAIGRRLADGLPRGELVVAPGGHRLALENPGAVAAAIRGPG